MYQSINLYSPMTSVNKMLLRDVNGRCNVPTSQIGLVWPQPRGIGEGLGPGSACEGLGSGLRVNIGGVFEWHPERSD